MTDLTGRIAELAAAIKGQIQEDENAAIHAGADGRFGGRPRWSARYGTIITDAEDEDWAVMDLSACIENRSVGEHVARHDPARVLRQVAATRTLVAAIQAEPHDYNPSDSYYSCSQAEDPDPYPGEGGPGSGCSNEERAGQPCDCGRDQRVARLLGIIAEGLDG